MWNALTKKNNPFLATDATSGLYEFPNSAIFDDKGYLIGGGTTSPIGKLPYIEINAGFENILRFIRIDYVRRITYNDYELPIQAVDANGNKMFNPETGEPIMGRRRIPAWGRNGVKISFRFAL